MNLLDSNRTIYLVYDVVVSLFLYRQLYRVCVRTAIRVFFIHFIFYNMFVEYSN